MRNSTASRSPPIVMSSPCTVATTSSPLLQPLHTHGHALPLVNLRSLSVLPLLCGVTRDVQAVSQQSAHVFVTWKVILERQFNKYPSLCWSMEVRPPQVKQCHDLSFMLARGDLRSHNFQRLQRRRRRVQLWSRMCLEFLRDPPRAHVGLPWLTLVGLRPSCLDGCLSRLTWAHLCGNPRVHLMATDVLHLFTSCLGAQVKVKPPAFVVIPKPSFSQSEQFLLILYMSFHHFILHVTCSFIFVVFMDNPSYPPCILCFLLLFPRLQLLLVVSQLFLHCSGNLMYPCSCLFHFLDCVVRVHTCRCTPVHLLCIRIVSRW